MTIEKKRWAVVDCGLYSNEKCCKMNLMAPVEQYDDLYAIAAEHMSESHAFKGNPDLPKLVRKAVIISEM